MAEMDAKHIDWLTFMQSLQSIAQTGIAYAKNAYDQERYQEILQIVSHQYSEITGMDADHISTHLFNEVGYATPKICVRAVVLKDNKILLVQESEEGLWSLPGGWAEVNLSPAESLAKEILEETGVNGKVERLLALWDKNFHEHPTHWPHTYLAFYYCTVEEGAFITSHEISDIDYFPIGNLPELSTHRVTQKQIKRLIEIYQNELMADFD